MAKPGKPPRRGRTDGAASFKAEVVRHPGRASKNNPRFGVTNLTSPPGAVYALY
jgi:hypothetical protein